MKKPKGKTADESRVEMVEVVLPNDANPLGNILGGKVMRLIESAGAIAGISKNSDRGRPCGGVIQVQGGIHEGQTQ